MRKCLLVLIFCLLWVDAWAATHYASPSGSASWANSTNTETPCSVATAFSNAAAGDIVYFRGGTYSVPAKDTGSTYVGYYNPAYSGTGDADANRIIFKAYTGETPVFDGTAGGSGDTSDYATIFGTNGRDYITFDGFVFQSDSGTKMGRIIIGGESISTNVTVKNCYVNGGSTTVSSTDNREGIRIERGQNILIQNCTIYNYRQSSNWPNTAGLKFYHDSNITIENCEIYNCSAGIFYKSAVSTATTRYNYIHDCHRGIYATPWSSGYDMPNHSYYHNVISKCAYSGLQVYIEDGSTANNLAIYNNTVYSPNTSGELFGIFVGAAGDWTASNSQRFYNNIILGSAQKATFCVGVISECDYNQYGNSGSFNVRTNYGGGAVTYSSLANWQASTVVTGGAHPDTHGLASNPVFVNTSGNYSALADFALDEGSPCLGAGKAGVDMGADISLVGTGAEPDPDPPSSTSRFRGNGLRGNGWH